MGTLLDRIRSELSARRVELVAELQEVDDALIRISGGNEPTFADPAANGSGSTGEESRPSGRPPSPETLAIDRWLRGWGPQQPGSVVIVDEAYRQAASLGLVAFDRNGRERIRQVLERMVRNHEAENLGGGRYRLGEVAT